MIKKHILTGLFTLLLVAACGKAEPDPQPVPVDEKDEITLTSEADINVDAEGGKATVAFKSSGRWSATLSQDAGWITIGTTSGEKGNATLTLTIAKNQDAAQRRATLTLACGQSSADVTINQAAADPDSGGQKPDDPATQPFEAVTVYYDDLDRTPAFSGFMTDNSWKNPVGEGAAEVTYDTWNASIRNDDYGSAGKNGTYEGASGKCYGRITQSSNGNFGHIYIYNVATCGHSNFTFSFGAAQGQDVLKLEVSPNGVEWTELDYSFGQSYNKWSKVSIPFSVGNTVKQLSFKFTLTGPKSSYTYGANLDDIKLETARDASGIKIGKDADGGDGNWNYAELPVYDRSNPDYYYNTLYSTTVKSAKRVRNYSFCYDTRRHNPIWVAFPMHAIYSEGVGRTTPDPWMKYPDLPVEQQSIIWDITGDGLHQYWTYSSYLMNYRYYWGRGHLCMSSSRPGAGSELNMQTFYPVNVAPQSAGPTFSTLWGETETLHYQNGTQVCADTLYVVAGCFYESDDNIEYDACYGTDRCVYSKPCVVPTHQYKLLLRTRAGNTGKPVQACQAGELKAIGFWFDTVMDETYSTDLRDYVVSVTEIERRTGITFFPDIPPEAKSQCAPSDWGL